MKVHLTYLTHGSICGRQGPKTHLFNAVTCKICRARMGLGPKPGNTRKDRTYPED